MADCVLWNSAASDLSATAKFLVSFYVFRFLKTNNLTKWPFLDILSYIL